MLSLFRNGPQPLVGDAMWSQPRQYHTIPISPIFQTPRVNGAVLSQFMGRTVCVVGKVVSYQQGAPEAELETSDGMRITVTLAAGSTWTSQYVEVIGHLHDDSTLQEFKSTDFGESFDMGLYDKAVCLMTGKFSYLFYSAQE